MMKLIEKLNKNIKVKRVSCLALVFIFAASLFGEFYNLPSHIAVAEEAGSNDGIANTYYYKWHLCTTDAEMQKWLINCSTDGDSYEYFRNRALILYGGSPTDPTYRLTGATYDSSKGSSSYIKGEAVTSADGIEASKSEFTTVSNFRAPFIMFAGKNVKGEDAYMLRFQSNDSSPSYDSKNYIIETEPRLASGNGQGVKDGYYYEKMRKSSFDKSMLYVYNCWVLHGGVQSATFFPLLVSTFNARATEDDIQGGGAYRKTPSRTAQLVMDFYGEYSTEDEHPEGTFLAFTYRKNLWDALWDWSNGSAEVTMRYWCYALDSWFKIYISTLVEKPAICSSVVYSGFTSNLIDSTIIKPGVMVIVKDGAVLRISGEVSNLGEINVCDGGTLIIDYGATLKSDLSTCKQNTTVKVNNVDTVYEVNPGHLEIFKGGQVIVLDDAVVDLPFIENNSTEFKIHEGGSMFLAGTMYCGSVANIQGELYMASGSKWFQGYYKSGDDLIEALQGLRFYDTAILTFEDNVSGACACGVIWYESDRNNYQKYGGIYYNYDSKTKKSLHLFPGITVTTWTNQSPGTVFSQSVDVSDDKRIKLTETVSYTPNVIGEFFGNKLDPLLNAANKTASGGSFTGQYTYYKDGKYGATLDDVGIKTPVNPGDNASADAKTEYVNQKAEFDNAKNKYNMEYNYANCSSYKVTSLKEVGLDCDGNEEINCDEVEDSGC